MLNSFATRIFLSIAVVLLVVVAGGTLAVLTAAQNTAINQGQRALEVAASVFEELLLADLSTALQNAEITANDFGFRQTVASRDAATMRSALDNFGQRIQADFGFVLNPEGQVVATTDDDAVPADADFLAPTLIEQARRFNGSAGIYELAGQAYETVLVPVRAPQQIGWAGFAFHIDDAYARRIHSLTGQHVSIWSANEERSEPLADSRRLLGGEIPRTRPDALDGAREAEEPRPNFSDVSDDGLVHVVSLDPTYAGAPLAMLENDLSEAMSAYFTLRDQMLLIGGLALLLAILSALWMGKLISRPVSDLAGRAREIAAGSYHIPVPTRRRDEIGQLGRAFNAMSEAVRDREDKLLYRLYHDPLTQLPNRTRLTIDLADELAALGADRRLTVALIDLRDFGEINNLLGPAVGDRLLQAVAQRMRELEPMLVARMGGDVFVWISERAVVDCGTEGERLLAQINGTYVFDDASIELEVVAGLVGAPEDGDSVEVILRRADIALNRAKRDRQPFGIYVTGEEDRYMRSLEIVAALRQLADAVRSQAALSQAATGLELAFQPKLDLRQGLANQAEALLRWTHPQLGNISPAEFIPLAEQSGTITDLTDWVLERAVGQIADWQGSGLDVRLSVNLSGRDLQDERLATRIGDILHAHGVSAGRLVVEVTETYLMEDLDQALATVAELKSLGLAISIDDFGTGYSSLAQLQRVQADELKIDREFLLRLDDSEDAWRVIQAMIRIGHDFGMTVVAEGVETDAVREQLASFGCDYAQGFGIAKPLSAMAYQEWLAARS
ncbi:bifunctional diguanylate cyclase/phosphodiesterase [Thioalkalivibrio sp. ALE9]|uniref:putative bifunctional diguanylate cyclase/phosphodiesterase n=1 Tax=Thioalkalivibrio sp. ALE9 TaxID=1158169 RepID=UPI00036C6267|nr:EAL domain-containing protein [Thioalkalivibrio sp. ALE9]